MNPDDFIPKLDIDAETDMSEIDDQLVEMLSQLEPFGTANPQPLFAAKGLSLTGVKFGQNPDHVFPTLGRVSCVSWNLRPLFQSIPVGSTVDVAFRPEFNDYRGRRELRWKLEDAISSVSA